jgi:hypothetical protein
LEVTETTQVGVIFDTDEFGRILKLGGNGPSRCVLLSLNPPFMDMKSTALLDAVSLLMNAVHSIPTERGISDSVSGTEFGVRPSDSEIPQMSTPVLADRRDDTTTPTIQP